MNDKDNAKKILELLNSTVQVKKSLDDTLAVSKVINSISLPKYTISSSIVKRYTNTIDNVFSSIESINNFYKLIESINNFYDPIESITNFHKSIESITSFYSTIPSIESITSFSNTVLENMKTLSDNFDFSHLSQSTELTEKDNRVLNYAFKHSIENKNLLNYDQEQLEEFIDDKIEKAMQEVKPEKTLNKIDYRFILFKIFLCFFTAIANNVSEEIVDTVVEHFTEQISTEQINTSSDSIYFNTDTEDNNQ